MDALLFHPKLVHVPIALGVLMPLIAAGLWVAWWRDWLPRKAWLLAVGLQVLLFGSGLLAIQTGKTQEERVEKVVPERFIEAHEEAAEAFVWASGAVLAVMLLGAALPRRSAGLGAAAVATLGTVVVLGLGYRTGQAGGELVYRHGAAQVYVAADAPPSLGPPSVASADDDDD